MLRSKKIEITLRPLCGFRPSTILKDGYNIIKKHIPVVGREVGGDVDATERKKIEITLRPLCGFRP